MGLRDRLKNKAKRTLTRLRGDEPVDAGIPTAAESNTKAAHKEDLAKAKLSEQLSTTIPEAKPAQPKTKTTKEKSAEIAAIKERFSLATKDAPTVEEIAFIQEQLVEAMRSVHDPEIPVNIYDLGLIYGMDVQATRHVDVRMTLTSPGCPVAQALVDEVQQKSCSVDGILTSTVELVWEPQWTMENMSEEAKLELDIL